MNKSVNSGLDAEVFQENLIKRYMIYQADRIANKLNKLYPEEFREADRQLELDIIQKYISKCTITIDTEEAVKYKLASQRKCNSVNVQRPIIDDAKRCCARVWDIKCIKIVTKDGKYVNYGRRCSRPRASKLDNKLSYYCDMHNKKNSHGDFREPNVPKHLETHFEKAIARFGTDCIMRI